VPVHCFLDEFANIGKIPGFEILMATIRSRGISVSVIVQGLSQGKAIWKDDWDTIVGNCDSVLFLGSRDETTNKWLSAQLGDETITMDEYSQTYGVSGSRTKSQRTLKRALLSPDEIGRLSNDEAILLIQGLRPFRSRKAAIRTGVSS
jgi:type IV secretion system protein VirD4